jgi:hypothetical protein
MSNFTSVPYPFIEIVKPAIEAENFVYDNTEVEVHSMYQFLNLVMVYLKLNLQLVIINLVEMTLINA